MLLCEIVKINTGIPLAPAGPEGPEGPCAPWQERESSLWAIGSCDLLCLSVCFRRRLYSQTLLCLLVFQWDQRDQKHQGHLEHQEHQQDRCCHDHPAQRASVQTGRTGTETLIHLRNDIFFFFFLEKCDKSEVVSHLDSSRTISTRGSIWSRGALTCDRKTFKR